VNQLTLAQVNEVQRAVQEHFQRGGSTSTVLIILGILVGIILTTYLLTRRQERRTGVTITNDPMGLYRELLTDLNLTAPQRKLMERAAKEAGLPHPAVILLSPKAFSRHVESRSTDSTRTIPQADQQSIAQLKETLFPPCPNGAE